MATGPTCVSDDKDDAGGDVIGAEDGDPVVVRVGDGELPLCHVQKRDGSDNLEQTRSGLKQVSWQPGLNLIKRLFSRPNVL